jgi:hypothetical protein
MESFEFLGGRYNRPEQIMSGPVQAFKAQNAANGRTVFIHRVSTTEAPAEQAALLKLLTTALVKSSEAKRLVLDFGEESGYWYVVTESEPQCALLREWLQLEIDSALAGAAPAARAAVPAASTAPTQKADPGEFTRFIQRPSVSSPGTVSRLGNPPINPPLTPPLPVPPATQTALPAGEFTRFFQAGENKPATPAAVQRPGDASARTPEQKQEPGEFTRFFTPGLPAVPPKQTAPVLPVMNFERTQNSPYVQRPNSPPPPLPAKQNEPGEFTRMFSHADKAADKAQHAASQPVDPMGFAKPQSSPFSDVSDNLFNNKIEVGGPLASSQPQQGEFTRLFGAVGSEAPPIAPPGVVAAKREHPMLDEGTRQLPVMRPQLPATPPSSGEVSAGTPSEFTMIMKGGYGQAKPAGEPAADGGQSAPGAMPIDLKIAPVGAALPNLMPGGASGSIAGLHGNVSQHGASASSAIGSAHVPAPAADVKILRPDKAAANKKLLLFFGLLGVLALVLIAVVMFLMKSK